MKLENVGIAVRDLDAAVAFFTDLGLTVLGRARIAGEWADTAVGLDGNTADVAVLQAPDGHGRIEMFQYVHPDAIEAEPVQPNTIGMHRVCLRVDDIDAALEIAAGHGFSPLRGVATYEDVYQLTYLRGPSGILVMFAEELRTKTDSMSDDRVQPGQGWADQERVHRWIAGARQREAQMAPVNDELFAAAALQPGEVVLDVGCGTGPTTARAAEVVGGGGRVVGCDLAPGMISAARQLVDRPGVEWLVADAQTHEFGEAAFDVVLSRFGLMFFPDPVAAFGNLARATRPGGRLVAAVWQTRDRAPFFDLPYRTAARVLDRLGLAYAPVPVDDSQCSLGSPDRVSAVLRSAGWTDVTTRPTDRALHLGGALSAEAAAESAVDVGPIRGLLEGRPAEVVDAVRAELLPEFRARHDGTGVVVPGGYLVVSARR